LQRAQHLRLVGKLAHEIVGKTRREIAAISVEVSISAFGNVAATRPKTTEVVSNPTNRYRPLCAAEALETGGERGVGLPG
jgi:hypothetical protein